MTDRREPPATGDEPVEAVAPNGVWPGPVAADAAPIGVAPSGVSPAAAVRPGAPDPAINVVELRRRQRSRSLVMGAILVALVVLFYAISLAKMF